MFVHFSFPTSPEKVACAPRGGFALQNQRFGFLFCGFVPYWQAKPKEGRIPKNKNLSINRFTIEFSWVRVGPVINFCSAFFVVSFPGGRLCRGGFPSKNHDSKNLFPGRGLNSHPQGANFKFAVYTSFTTRKIYSLNTRIGA